MGRGFKERHIPMVIAVPMALLMTFVLMIPIIAIEVAFGIESGDTVDAINGMAMIIIFLASLVYVKLALPGQISRLIRRRQNRRK